MDLRRVFCAHLEIQMFINVKQKTMLIYRNFELPHDSPFNSR